MRTRKVLFTKPVNRFVAEDLKEYGPFYPGDVAEIPEATAEVVFRRGYGWIVLGDGDGDL